MKAVNKVCRKALESTTVATIFKVDEIDTPDGEIKRLSNSGGFGARLVLVSPISIRPARHSALTSRHPTMKWSMKR